MSYFIREARRHQDFDADLGGVIAGREELELRLVPEPETDMRALFDLLQNGRRVQIVEAYPPPVPASDEQGREKLVYGFKLALSLLNQFAIALEKSGCCVRVEESIISRAIGVETPPFEGVVTRKYR